MFGECKLANPPEPLENGVVNDVSHPVIDLDESMHGNSNRMHCRHCLTITEHLARVKVASPRRATGSGFSRVDIS